MGEYLTERKYTAEYKACYRIVNLRSFDRCTSRRISYEHSDSLINYLIAMLMGIA